MRRAADIKKIGYVWLAESGTPKHFGRTKQKSLMLSGTLGSAVAPDAFTNMRSPQCLSSRENPTKILSQLKQTRAMYPSLMGNRKFVTKQTSRFALLLPERIKVHR
jgi:hypothetical protein